MVFKLLDSVAKLFFHASAENLGIRRANVEWLSAADPVN